MCLGIMRKVSKTSAVIWTCIMQIIAVHFTDLVFMTHSN